MRLMQVKKITGTTADIFLEYVQRNLPEGVSMAVYQVRGGRGGEGEWKGEREGRRMGEILPYCYYYLPVQHFSLTHFEGTIVCYFHSMYTACSLRFPGPVQPGQYSLKQRH